MKDNRNLAVGFFLLASIGSGTLLSCTSSQAGDTIVFSLGDFKEHISLTTEPLNMDTLDIIPYSMQVYGDILLVNNYEAPKEFSVYSLSQKRKLSDQIEIGQGPEDMIQTGFVNDNDDKILYLADEMTSKVFKYDFSEFAKPEPVKSLQQVKLEKRGYGSIRKVGDKFYVPSHKPGFLMYQFDASTGTLTDSIGTYPTPDFEMNDVEKTDTYMFFSTSNEKNRLALCYQTTDFIDIYDKEGRLLKRLSGPDHFTTRFKQLDDKRVIISRPVDNRDAFRQPVSVGDELWVPYLGKKSSDPNYNTYTRRILVFSWEGKPLRIIDLDVDIYHLTVDESTRTIYAISETPDTHIIRCNY